jgi:phosphate transport system substrate-binding protein
MAARMSKLPAAVLLAACLCLAVAAPGLAGELDRFGGLSGRLRIVGSEAGPAAVREAASRIMAAHPGITVDIAACGTGVGLRQVAEAKADLSLSDRDMETFLDHGALIQTPYAVDPVALVVNPVNELDGVTLDQARGILSARYTTWAELGGRPDTLIPVYLEASPAADMPLTASGTMSVSTQPAVKFVVSHNKDLAGYVSLRDLDASLKALRLDGVAPGMAAFLAGNYRVYRILRLVGRAGPTPLARAFAAYMQGPEGQDILEAAGYAPLRARPDGESLLAFDAPEALAHKR